MQKVFTFSGLLLLGMILSQLLPRLGSEIYQNTQEWVKLLTMFCLSYIMIHVGLEFDIDRTRLRRYAVDYGVAATAAAFPWIFVTMYFIFILTPSTAWGSFEAWREALLAGRFAAPTSAGILFAMLAAAGLSGTWTFGKTRILAIFDDLDTVLLMIPLKMLIVGLAWQLGVIVFIMALQIYIAWKYLHSIKLPTTWKWVLLYSGLIAAVSEIIYLLSKMIDEVVTIHIEVLLPAFVLGTILAIPHKPDSKAEEDHPLHQQDASEERVAYLISSIFMVLVGLTMPQIFGKPASFLTSMGWGIIFLHVLAITVLSNLGKMFPVLVYRQEATVRERLAVCIAMFPRGEVGAGIIVVSLAYGISEVLVTVAIFSLALNLLLTGLFIVMVKQILKKENE